MIHVANVAFYGYELDVADVDGDGDVDVLFVNERNSTIAWLENLDGAGAFGPARVISAPPP